MVHFVDSVDHFVDLGFYFVDLGFLFVDLDHQSGNFLSIFLVRLTVLVDRAESSFCVPKE